MLAAILVAVLGHLNVLAKGYLAGSGWASHFTSLGLSFLFCTRRTWGAWSLWVRGTAVRCRAGLLLWSQLMLWILVLSLSPGISCATRGQLFNFSEAQFLPLWNGEKSPSQSIIKACMLCCVWLFATLCTVACQDPLSTEFSRQEYWGELPFPTLADLPDPGMDPMSLVSPALAGRFFTTSTTWDAQRVIKRFSMVNACTASGEGISPGLEGRTGE